MSGNPKQLIYKCGHVYGYGTPQHEDAECPQCRLEANNLTKDPVVKPPPGNNGENPPEVKPKGNEGEKKDGEASKKE